MCGIVGYVGYARKGQWRETHQILRELLIAAEHRGRDATGFVACAEPLDWPHAKGIVLSKAPVRAGRFVEIDPAFGRLQHQRCSVVLGHVRQATHGDPADNRNNHPFASGNLYLVHNGVVGNHRELADRHSLELKTACDSEVLLRLVESSEDPGIGLLRCLREVEGSMAAVVYDRDAGLVWVARNRGRPLWLARLRRDKRLFFASTSVILIDALRKVRGTLVNGQFELLVPLAENAPVAISPDGMIIAPYPSAD